MRKVFDKEGCLTGSQIRDLACPGRLMWASPEVRIL